MKMAKIIILILASDTYPSKRNAKYQKRTWVKDLNQNIKVLFYEAGNKNELNNGHLTFTLSKSEKDIGYKNIEAFKWVLENEKFDFLFRTNTSSYISKTNLEKYISTLDANKKYIKYVDYNILDDGNKTGIPFPSNPNTPDKPSGDYLPCCGDKPCHCP